MHEGHAGEDKAYDPRAQSLKALEFDKVLAWLASRASSDLGRQLAEHLTPADTFESARLRLAETTEARVIADNFGYPSFQGACDIRELARRAKQGSVLSPIELIAVFDMLGASRRLKGFITRHRAEAPNLGEMARNIPVLAEVERAIERTVSKDGEVLDDATQRLSAIRREKRVLNQRIRDRLESIIRSPDDQRYLQDLVVGIREGRYVVPVKAEFRSKVPGIVHDRSSSGATLFIEPMSIVAMNNELKVLALEEKAEIERILSEVSGLVGSFEAEIDLMCDLMGQIDLAFAKARISQEMNAVEPQLNLGGVLLLREARHPLLREKAVPIDVRLGTDFDTLLITGPNTGGKTVALKTVGLLALMAGAGLHIPVLPGSTMAFFNGIYCDIGDEQSIEQSLSTFSAHMRNIIPMIRESSANSLVLLDEVGAGTDPAEGTALAMALLEHFHQVGAKTIATSHYGELKAFVFSRERMENASVVFDVETLRPTYELKIGLPGNSNALEIASRLGLPKTVVDRAVQFLGKEKAHLERLINHITSRQEEMTRLLEEADTRKRRARQLEEELRERLEEIERRRSEILERARETADEIVRSARRKATDLIRNLRKAEMSEAFREKVRQAESAKREFEESVRVLSRGMITEQPVVRGVDEKSQPPPSPRARPGAKALVRTIGQVGDILEVGDGEAKVQVGSLKFLVSLDELRPLGPKSSEEGGEQPQERGVFVQGFSSDGLIAMDKARTVSPEIMLRGLKVEEALKLADKYLDDAYLAGLKSVKIVHGKGTGALRRAIQELLSGHPHVESYRIGEKSEGGEGVTVAELRL